MRKLLLFFALTAFALSSCSTDNEVYNGEKGSISLKSGVDMRTNIKTRENQELTDFSGYTLTLSGAEDKVVESPEGTITDLTPGTYTVNLSNYEDSFTMGFDSPRYEGETTGVVVEPGEDTEVALTLYQANVGVTFIYEDLEGTALEGVIPAVYSEGTTKGGVSYSGALTYSGEAGQIGYFNPGDVVVSFKLGDTVIPVEGSESKTYTLSAREILQVTLKAASTDGSLTISATISDDTNEREADLVLDIPQVPGADTNFQIKGLSDQTVTVYFAGGNSTTVDLDWEGKGLIELASTRAEIPVVTRIVTDEEDVIYIGRLLDGTPFEAAINPDAAEFEIKLREADDKGIPVGIISEFYGIANFTDLSGNYYQDADLYFDDYEFGKISKMNGTYDGNGFSLNNITFNHTFSYDAAIFAKNGGTIKNVTVNNYNLTAETGRTGVICGQNQATGRIENCVVTDCTITNAGKDIAGIICGENSGTITGCRVDGESSISGANNVGGIVGTNKNIVEYCYSNASVTATATYAGGICGLDGSTDSRIMACLFEGKAHAQTQYVGGISGNCVGQIIGCKSGIEREGTEYSTNTTDCTLTTGWACSGGITGFLAVGGKVIACYSHMRNVGQMMSNVGGIVGEVGTPASPGALISACYFVGFAGGQPGGAIVGKANNGGPFNTTENCFWGYCSLMAFGQNQSNQPSVGNKAFDDGFTSTSYGAGWPAANLDNWGIYVNDASLEEGGYWKNLGTQGQMTYPKLWWE